MLPLFFGKLKSTENFLTRARESTTRRQSAPLKLLLFSMTSFQLFLAEFSWYTLITFPRNRWRLWKVWNFPTTETQRLPVYEDSKRTQNFFCVVDEEQTRKLFKFQVHPSRRSTSPRSTWSIVVAATSDNSQIRARCVASDNHCTKSSTQRSNQSAQSRTRQTRERGENHDVYGCSLRKKRIKKDYGIFFSLRKLSSTSRARELRHRDDRLWLWLIARFSRATFHT